MPCTLPAAAGICPVTLNHGRPQTACMPCHPHHFTKPFAAVRGTAPALLREAAGHGAVVQREAACGIAADNLLTDWEAPASRKRGSHTDMVRTRGLFAGLMQREGLKLPEAPQLLRRTNGVALGD
jgi:hypothetical protein